MSVIWPFLRNNLLIYISEVLNGQTKRHNRLMAITRRPSKLAAKDDSFCLVLIEASPSLMRTGKLTAPPNEVSV
jgi:hypothetical protein